ncbi:MAG: gamma carbonic anhydrase family protein [Pseudomonadales bacterium]|jgi:carbonic anhydrase/acetyltransferase-like protein (isoleucine patch superfamily)|nr:gamma carbonic anhydrase family protein [Pseudomonadales bacterium]MDP6470744.1 gamma carbonic anhydrase family protein [Pseudomonadales bacterium]MDP6828304.1 gamma carbonic anhydrase family protein [Pseudomonadales bacterium]MDP6972146.1 gamma carbonic anhydrase family protein [Pseudomonadales bacterium]|tara:strand:+ start:703 stop:1296 length:594 start_codon:yes stop_codon:yes gene_type:complete
MIKSFNGITPSIPAPAYVSETALIMGDVVMGEHCGVWPRTVIRGDFATIRIGSGTIIEDNVVVHTDTDMIIGDNVILGHGAMVHCRCVGNNSLIANNITPLDDAEIGEFCIIGAGSVVSPGTSIPSRSLAFGVPGKVAGELKAHQMRRLERGNQSYLAMFEQAAARAKSVYTTCRFSRETGASDLSCDHLLKRETEH